MNEHDDYEVGAHTARIIAARDAYRSMSLNELCFEMDSLREQKDALEEQLKHINAKYDTIRHEMLPARMEEDGVASPYNVAGLGRVTLTADLRVKVKDKDGLYDWLESNRLGDLIQQTVNAATLKASMKKRLIEGKDIPECVECDAFTRASITKTKKA